MRLVAVGIDYTFQRLFLANIPAMELSSAQSSNGSVQLPHHRLPLTFLHFFFMQQTRSSLAMQTHSSTQFKKKKVKIIKKKMLIFIFQFKMNGLKSCIDK